MDLLFIDHSPSNTTRPYCVLISHLPTTMPPLQNPRNRITKQLIVCMAVYTHTYLIKSARNTSALSGEVFVNELLHGHPRPIFDAFRMPIPTFRDLCMRLLK